LIVWHPTKFIERWKRNSLYIDIKFTSKILNHSWNSNNKQQTEVASKTRNEFWFNPLSLNRRDEKTNSAFHSRRTYNCLNTIICWSNIYIAIQRILITEIYLCSENIDHTARCLTYTLQHRQYWSHGHPCSENIDHTAWCLTIHCNTNDWSHRHISMFWKYWSHSELSNIYIAIPMIDHTDIYLCSENIDHIARCLYTLQYWSHRHIIFWKYWSHSKISNIYIAILIKKTNTYSENIDHIEEMSNIYIVILITETYTYSKNIDHIARCLTYTCNIDHTDISIIWKYWSHSEMSNIYIAIQTISITQRYPCFENIDHTARQAFSGISHAVGYFQPNYSLHTQLHALPHRKLPATGWTTEAAIFRSCNTIATRKQ